jgi:hypothetical protein
MAQKHNDYSLHQERVRAKAPLSLSTWKREKKKERPIEDANEPRRAEKRVREG